MKNPNPTLENLLEKNISVPSGMVSEMELMRFFTTISCLGLVDSMTGAEAYNTLLDKLECVK